MTLTEGNKNESQEQEERLKQYKNVAKHEDMRRRRTECSVEIRKQKGADMMMKRRNLQVDDDEVTDVSDTEAKPATTTTPAPRLSNAEVISILSNSPTVEQMRICFESIRRSLSKTKNPPVDEVIQCGLLDALVQALNVQDEKVQFEAAWALTNIVSGNSEQTFAVVSKGAAPPLIALIRHSSHQLAEQALWAVANIAGDSAQLRDHIIEYGGVDALMYVVEKISTLEASFARTISWAFSNMCRHKNPHAPLPVLTVISQGLAKLVAHEDKQVRQDACWAVSYLTDGPDEQIKLAKTSGLLPYILKFLRESDPMVAPALRVLGNMATGNDELTQCVIDLGTLHEIIPLAERSRSVTVVKECCWLVSNIIAGTQAQIQSVIDAGILSVIVEVLRSGDYKSQYEASWAVANLAQGGTSQQILVLVQDHAVPALCNLLSQTNVDLLTNALETLHAILHTVSNVAPLLLEEVKDAIEESEGLDAMEKLQNSESEKVYLAAYRIINDYFTEEIGDDVVELDQDENVPPPQFEF